MSRSKDTSVRHLQYCYRDALGGSPPPPRGQPPQVYWDALIYPVLLTDVAVHPHRGGTGRGQRPLPHPTP